MNDVNDINPIGLLDEKIAEFEVDRYFDKNKSKGGFVPKRLAEDIIKKFKIITFEDSKEMYLFDEEEGIWKPNAESKIESFICSVLGELVKEHYIEETISILKKMTYKKREDIENLPLNLVPVQNGILDLENRKLIPFSPDYFFTFKIPVTFNPDADCPRIKGFLKEVVATNEEVELLIEIIAYCLWRGNPHQKAFIFTGGGSNGKSTFFNLLTAFLGKDKISSISLHEIENNRFAMAGLYQKHANIYADLPSITLTNSGTFKMITGEDLVKIEEKFKRPKFARIFAKPIFSANKMPFVRDESDAFFRRLIIIEFPFIFKEKPDPQNPYEKRRNPKILAEITTPQELSGLLNMCVERINKILTNGFTYNKSTLETREDYLRRSDPIGTFVNEHLVEDPDSYVSKDLVYNSYIKFCKKNKFTVVDKNVFGKNLRRHIAVFDYRPRDEKGERITAWKGVRLIEVDEDEKQSNDIHEKNKLIEGTPDQKGEMVNVVNGMTDDNSSVLHDYGQVGQGGQGKNRYFYLKNNKSNRTRLTELYKSLGSRKVPVDILKQHFTDEEISKMLENGDIFEPSKDLFILVNYDEVELS
jgi:putative DNA primase/helicase